MWGAAESRPRATRSSDGQPVDGLVVVAATETVHRSISAREARKASWAKDTDGTASGRPRERSRR